MSWNKVYENYFGYYLNKMEECEIEMDEIPQEPAIDMPQMTYKELPKVSKTIDHPQIQMVKKNTTGSFLSDIIKNMSNMEPEMLTPEIIEKKQKLLKLYETVENIDELFKHLIYLTTSHADFVKKITVKQRIQQMLRDLNSGLESITDI